MVPSHKSFCGTSLPSCRTRREGLLSLDVESAPVKLFGRRPPVGRATRAGAGVRKAARDETARWER